MPATRSRRGGPQRHAVRRQHLLRRQHRHGVADADAELLRQIASDENAVAVLSLVGGALVGGGVERLDAAAEHRALDVGDLLLELGIDPLDHSGAYRAPREIKPLPQNRRRRPDDVRESAAACPTSAR